MGFLVFILFLLLVISLFLTLAKKGRLGLFSRTFRVITIVLGVAFFSYWFFESSVTRYLKDSLSAQIINKLPQPLDFYVIRIDKDGNTTQNIPNHIGKIRPEYFRLEYLPMQKSDEFWVAGFLGKNMVYFSQHSVPNKNKDQIIEVNNYIIQSEKLAKKANDIVKDETQTEIVLSIWVTLTFLLLFLNIVLLFRKTNS